jgi:hypothetical protein
MYDLIGDIHGHYELLVQLLKKLGYVRVNNSYQHPLRKVIFMGDIINRGNKIRLTVRLIRRMVELGNAYCILGNHELNAILYTTLDKSGKALQKRLPRYKLPLNKTLEEYQDYPEEWIDTVKWFRTLPVYIDLGDLRVVHGSWNESYIETYKLFLRGEEKLKKGFLKTYLINKELRSALDGLIKGEELQLPKDLLVKDNYGIVRRSFRIKWWEPVIGKTFREVAFGNRFELPNYTIPKEIIPEIKAYPADSPPVFNGHYCLDSNALIFKGNICCIDTCVTRNQRLTAYRWSGEQQLNAENFVEV